MVFTVVVRVVPVGLCDRVSLFVEVTFVGTRGRVARVAKVAVVITGLWPLVKFLCFFLGVGLMAWG